MLMLPALLASALGLIAPSQQVAVLGRTVPAAAASGGSPGLLQSGDLSCDGAFLMASMTASITWVQNPPVATRNVSGTQHFYTIRGTDGHLLDEIEPTLVSCSSAIGSMNAATLATTGNGSGDWGVFPSGGSDGYPPLTGTATHPGQFFGLYWDATDNWLIGSWSGNYAAIPNGINSFAAATFGASTLSTVGCWGITGSRQPSTGSGSLTIPASFLSTYSGFITGTKTLAQIGGGQTASVGGEVSEGPAVVAYAPPSGNACTAGTDTNVPGTTLALYESNNTSGPTCATAAQGAGTQLIGITLGCTPSVAPTSPYAAKLQHTNYSVNLYQQSYDPYNPGTGTVGYITTSTIQTGWYDDGTKHGVLSIFAMPEGWANTTVSGGVSGSYPNYTMTLTDTTLSTHDGGHINVNDYIWVEACSTCAIPNGGQLTTALVTSVNTSTGAVGITMGPYLTGSDDSACHPTQTSTCGEPVVGGSVFFGCVYASGQPTCSRSQLVGQIYDPAEYGKVLNGTYTDPSQPVYASEFDLPPLGVQAWGATNPIASSTTSPGNGVQGQHPAIAIIADAANQKLYVVFANAAFSPVQQVVYRFSVSHTP